MAINTAERRRSAAAVGVPIVGPGVTPNASKDAEWRQQAAWSYSGIAASGPVEAFVYTLAATTDGTSAISVAVDGAAALTLTVDGAAAISVEVDQV